MVSGIFVDHSNHLKFCNFDRKTRVLATRSNYESVLDGRKKRIKEIMDGVVVPIRFLFHLFRNSERIVMVRVCIG